jgi:hypothetical protein
MKILFVVLALALTPLCLADFINFNSGAATLNSSGSPTVAAVPDSSWEPPINTSEWITAEDDKDPALDTQVTFTVDLDLPTGFSDAVLMLGVYADDSATVKIDSTALFEASFDLGPHCSAVTIGCMPGTEGVINNLNVTSDLHAGENTLTFDVVQEVGDTPFGLDFSGGLVYTAPDPPPPPPDPPPSVPEPGSILLLLSAVLPAGYMIRRKASSSR